MKVKVSYLGYLGGVFGKDVEYIELPQNVSLADFLKILLEIYGEKFEKEVYDVENQRLKHGFSIIINNNLILGGSPVSEIMLKEGDHVLISPLIAGG